MTKVKKVSNQVLLGTDELKDRMIAWLTDSGTTACYVEQYAAELNDAYAEDAAMRYDGGRGHAVDNLRRAVIDAVIDEIPENLFADSESEDATGEARLTVALDVLDAIADKAQELEDAQ